MKRTVKDLNVMVNSINAHHSKTGNPDRLLLHRAKHGQHSYAYMITLYNQENTAPLLNWSWFAECAGFLKAYMKDMEFKVELESQVQARVEELRCKEFSNLVAQIDELKAELAGTKTNKQEDDRDNSVVIKENKELKLKISELEEDLNNAQYAEAMADHGETEAILHNKKLLEKLETLENETARLRFELSSETSLRNGIEERLKKALSESMCPAGNLLVPSTQTITHNIRNSVIKSAEYLQMLFSAFNKGCLTPLSLNDASTFLEFSKNGVITARIRSLILNKYITYIQLAHLT